VTLDYLDGIYRSSDRSGLIVGDIVIDGRGGLMVGEEGAFSSPQLGCGVEFWDRHQSALARTLKAPNLANQAISPTPQHKNML